MAQKRGSFTGKIGFVLAAAGSAVGLGNLWRFPYLAAKYGGGIFLLVYIALAVTFGFALMTAEIALGRKTGLSAIGAFEKLNSKYSFIGVLVSIVPMIILPYYCVIGGWVTKYLALYTVGTGAQAAEDSFFGGFIGQAGEPLVWFAIYVGLTALVVLFGVEKGIEKVSKFLMPVLVVLTLGIAVFSIIKYAKEGGVAYYLLPDFSQFSFTTVIGAMGQMFYSMSLAMGIMITYGSYMKKQDSIESSVRQIEIFDTGIAFLAGLMIIPAVFAASGEEGINKGAGLMFVGLPKIFASIGGVWGNVIGAVFFLLVLFAALTSSISLMETVVSILHDKFKLSRKISCLTVILICAIIGIPSSLGNGVWADIKIIGMDFLTFFDFISNSVLMPIVAFLTCIFVGYIIKPKSIIDEVESDGNTFKGKRLFSIVIRFVAPVCIIAILIFSVLEGLGIFTV